MAIILADIFNQFQHIYTLTHSPERYCPKRCPHCYNNKLWRHGVYYRQAQCESQGQAVPIPRHFCPSCNQTCSTLPEYIAPRRWYYWLVQQAALLLLMLGKRAEVACEALSHQLPVTPSVDTLYRWLRQLSGQFPSHRFHLCNLHPELGIEPGFEQFWPAYFEQEGGLSSAMLALNRAGQVVP